MLWLARPPYLRWLAVGVALLLSMWLELRPAPTVDHPFALNEIRPGETITDADVEWREVPVGVLEPVTLPLVSTRLVLPGEPLPPTSQPAEAAAPEGWWALSLPTPIDPRAGEEVRVVVGSEVDMVVPGIVVGSATDDTYGSANALVAVPGESVTAVAGAAAAGEVTVLVRAGR